MSAKSVPRESDDDFGPPVFAYYPSRTIGFLGVFLLVAVTAFLVLTYYKIGPFNLVLPILLAILLVPLSFMLIRELFRTPYKIGQEGFAVYKQAQWLIYLWQDLAAIWLITTYAQSSVLKRSCRVMFDDGSRLNIEGISETLVRWIAERAYHSIDPKIQAEFASGRPVRFGGICLSKDGIHSGRHLLSWPDVASVKPERNESDIVIREKGHHLRHHIPWKELDGVGIHCCKHQFLLQLLA